MQLLSHLVLLFVGLAALIDGGDRVVKNASACAHELGLSTLFVGVTLVAVGSSIPEIATSIYSGVYRAPRFAVGHIVGSATSQITVGVGVVALLSPLALERSRVKLFGGGMMVAMGLMLATLWSGTVTRLESVVLMGAYLSFLALSYEEMGVHEAVDEPASDVDRTRTLLGLLAGLTLVVLGGHLLVVHSRQVAVTAGVSPVVVGLVTGLGTTAPEIAISGFAVLDDRANIAVGTLFGSNITDPLFSFGVGAFVSGFTFAHVDALLGSAAYMLVASAIVVAVFLVRGEVGRIGAVGCLALYLPTFFI